MGEGCEGWMCGDWEEGKDRKKWNGGGGTCVVGEKRVRWRKRKNKLREGKNKLFLFLLSEKCRIVKIS